MIKANVSNGFYWVGLRQSDATKLGLVFPSEEGQEELVTILLTMPMAWKNSPPIFCTLTEMVEDLTNEVLQAHALTQSHKLDDHA